MRQYQGQGVIPFGRCVVLFGNELFHFITKGRGGLSGLAFEHFGEVGLFVVAQFKTDFGNGLVGVDEQVFGLGEFAGLDDLANTLLHYFLTDEVQVALTHEELFGIKGDLDRSSEILFQNMQKICVGLRMCIGCIMFHLFRFFIVHHGDQGGEQLFDDGQVGIGLLDFVVHHFTEGGKSVKATTGGQGNIGPVMKIVVQFEDGLGHELRTETDDPEITGVVMGPWTQSVRFALGHKGNEGGVDRFIIKIDKMGNLALVPNDQLFKIVYMGLNAFALEGFGIFRGKLENFEELFQRVLDLCLCIRS